MISESGGLSLESSAGTADGLQPTCSLHRVLSQFSTVAMTSQENSSVERSP